MIRIELLVKLLHLVLSFRVVEMCLSLPNKLICFCGTVAYVNQTKKTN